jgi:predicted phosphodiesterase
MRLQIHCPEVVGVTESSLTIAFGVEDANGPVDAEARVRVGGELRDVSAGARATRLVRVEGLEPDTVHSIEIEVDGAPAPERDDYFPAEVKTQPLARARQVATLASLNDLHFGEARMGGQMTEEFEYGGEAPGFPVVRDSDTETPYSHFMNQDAVADINAAGVDLAIIKGDIADSGLPDQFEVAAQTFAGFDMPHHAFLGNHDHLALLQGEPVDGYGLLGQEPAPRVVEHAGWRLVLLDTNLPGEHHGVFPEERLGWLEGVLSETREGGEPALLFMHHHPVPPEHAGGYPNSIGLDPQHSLRLFDVIAQCSQVRGVLVGHTHRNRVRRYAATGAVPFVEVSNPKDYPGGFGHYRLYEDGSFRQEVRRTASERALTHSTKCRDLFRGFYRRFALGKLSDRSFVAEG